MATYSRAGISGTSYGMPIAVTGTSIAGATTTHTAIAGTAGWDEVYLWAANVSSVAATLSVTWGNTTAANHICSSMSIPANSPLIPIATGQTLQNGLNITAYSGTASAINLIAIVNRIQ